MLGPLLYLLYTAELEQLVLRHGLYIHQYAVDSQVHTSVPISDVQAAVHSFAVCVLDVNKWMRASRLQLNPSKTQVLWRGSGQQLKHVDISGIPVLSTSVPVVETVLPAAATTPRRSIDDGGSCKDRSRGIYMVPVGLL